MTYKIDRYFGRSCLIRLVCSINWTAFPLPSLSAGPIRAHCCLPDSSSGPVRGHFACPDPLRTSFWSRRSSKDPQTRPLGLPQPRHSLENIKF